MFLCWIIKACGWSVPHWVTVNFVILCILKVLSVSLVASAIFWQYQIMDGTISSKTITYLFMSCAVLFFVHAQYPDGTVLLKQGTVIGVRFNGIRLHFLNWFTCFYRNIPAKHLLHFLIISTLFWDLSISAENIPWNIQNGRLFISRHSICSTTNWLVAICG